MTNVKGIPWRMSHIPKHLFLIVIDEAYRELFEHLVLSSLFEVFCFCFSKCWQKQISDEGRATVASSLDFSLCVNVFVSEPLWLQRAFSVAPFKWPCSYLHKLATVCLLFQPNQLVRGLHCFCLVRGGGKVDCVTALLQQRALCLTACSPGRLNVHHDAVVVLSVMETFQQQIKKQKQSSHN